MFQCAKLKRGTSHNDLTPFWIFPNGDAKIERHVPALPHSREIDQQINLQRSLVLYRMVFGQNRQEDLIAYLRDRFTDDEIAHLIERCCIDLSPTSHCHDSPRHDKLMMSAAVSPERTEP